MSTDNVTQEMYCSLTKATLALLGKELVLSKLDKNLIYMLPMLLSRFGKDENIIYVTQDKLAKEGAKHIIHDALEGSWGISETKCHHSGLKVTKRCTKCSLVLITRSDANVVVARSEINGREVLCTMQLI
jgi:hypothetical protein